MRPITTTIASTYAVHIVEYRLLLPPGLLVFEHPPSRFGPVCVSKRSIKRIGMAETTPLLFSMRSNVYGTAWTPGQSFFLPLHLDFFFARRFFKLGNYIIWIFSVINILCLCFCVWFFPLFFLSFIFFKFMLWLHTELAFCRAIRGMNINKFLWDLMGDETSRLEEIRLQLLQTGVY